jgi:hypothetical protein
MDNNCGHAELGSENEFLFTDLVDMVDENLLDASNPDLWKAIPYETESFSGVMLGCDGGENAVPISLRVDLEGWFRIWVAIYSFGNTRSMRFKLSGDLCFHTIATPVDGQGISAESLYLWESPWKVADLTGQEIIVEPDFVPSEYTGAGLAYIRLERIETPAVEQKRVFKYPLTITEDGYGIFGIRPFSRPEDLLEPFERVPNDSCLRTLIWGTLGGDMASFPTRVGNYPLVDARVTSQFQKTFFNNLALFRDKGWNSLEIVREYARKRGWKFHVYLRMQAFYSPFPLDKVVYSEFFMQNPEYHCLDREGNRVMRLSYAYPEVQSHMVNVIREISEYNPDGICLAFIRGVPLVLYEPPMVNGFLEKYGIDPRQLSETEPRWLEYQAEVVISFLKKVKESLKSGQRLSVIVPANEFDCVKWGLDVRAWLRDGIVDDLIPTGQRFDDMDVHRDDPGNLDFNYFNELPGREKIKLTPMLYPWEVFSTDYPAWKQYIFSYLNNGADGYTVWDALWAGDFNQFELGCEDQMEDQLAEPVSRKTRLKSLDGFRFDRYHYFEVV